MRSTSPLLVIALFLFHASIILADPNRRYLIGLAKHDLWVRAAPSANPNMARIKVDDIAPDKEYKGLSYSWELKPLERNSHSFEIRNSATGLSIVGFDIDNDRLAATPGKGSTWEIIQYHGERYVIKLAGTQLVWTFERDVTGGHNAGNVRLRPYSEETHGQVWVFKVDHPHHIPDDEIWMM